MKNHIKVNGQLLQTNKKWSHLKQKQVQYIYDKTVELHTKYVAEHGKLPRKQHKNDIVNGVYEELNINISYSEARPHINKYIDRLNRKLEKQNSEYLQSQDMRNRVFFRGKTRYVEACKVISVLKGGVHTKY